MSHEYEISQLRQKIQMKEEDIDRLKRLISSAEEMTSYMQRISTDRLDIESDVWRDFTTNTAQSSHDTLNSEKGHIQNSVQNGLQQAYKMIDELQAAISSAEHEIRTLRELDAKEEK